MKPLLEKRKQCLSWNCKFIYVVMPNFISQGIVLCRISGGELFERVIDPSFQLTEEVAAKCLRQICAGVGFMHSRSILHLDLKVGQ